MNIFNIFGIMFTMITFIVFTIPLYILESFAVYTIAGKRGLTNPWIAWIPIARQFTLGSIVDDIADNKGDKSYFRWILLIGGILSGIVSNTLLPYSMGNMMNYSYLNNLTDAVMYSIIRSSFISWLIGIVFFVFGIIALYRIYKEYRPDSAVLFTVLSALFVSLLRPIFLFVIRNDEPANVYPSGYYPPPPGYPPYGGYPPPGFNPGGYPPPPDFNQSGYQPPPSGFNPAGYQPPPSPNPAGQYAPPASVPNPEPVEQSAPTELNQAPVEQPAERSAPIELPVPEPPPNYVPPDDPWKNER